MFTRIKNYINRKKNAKLQQHALRSSNSIIDKIDPESLQSIVETVTDFLDNDDAPSKHSHSTPTPTTVVTPSPYKTSHHSHHSFHDSHDAGGYDCSDSSSSDCGGGSDGGGGCGCD